MLHSTGQVLDRFCKTIARALNPSCCEEIVHFFSSRTNRHSIFGKKKQKMDGSCAQPLHRTRLIRDPQPPPPRLTTTSRSRKLKTDLKGNHFSNSPWNYVRDRSDTTHTALRMRTHYNLHNNFVLYL